MSEKMQIQRITGFTLIELIVGVAIISIIVSVAIPGYTRYITQAHSAQFSRLYTDAVQLARNHSAKVNAANAAGLTSTAFPNSAESWINEVIDPQNRAIAYDGTDAYVTSASNAGTNSGRIAIVYNSGQLTISRGNFKGMVTAASVSFTPARL